MLHFKLEAVLHEVFEDLLGYLCFVRALFQRTGVTLGNSGRDSVEKRICLREGTATDGGAPHNRGPALRGWWLLGGRWGVGFARRVARRFPFSSRRGVGSFRRATEGAAAAASGAGTEEARCEGHARGNGVGTGVRVGAF